ncbi:MAG: aspartyl protease family protein [Acidobacteria bacterium]|nr:aspartyl protease family protein [Acidobacteriota bacterium]
MFGRESNSRLIAKRNCLGSIAVILVLAAGALQAHASADTDADIRSLTKRADKLTRDGNLDGAEKLLRQAVALDKDRTDTQLSLALVLAKERNLLEAYNISYAIAQRDKTNSRAFTVLGLTLLNGGRFKEAEFILYNALRLNRKEHLAWATVAMLDFFENHVDDALANIREAIMYEQDEPDYFFALGQISARAEKYAEAAGAYQQYLDLSRNPDDDRRARIRGLVDFLTFLGSSSNLYLPAASDETAVQFDLEGNRPVVLVHINKDQRPLRFVLDTGSGITVLSEETAKRMKVKAVARGGYARGIGGDGKFEIVYGLLKQVDIGDVAIRNVPIYIRKFNKEAVTNADGYIGLAVISKFLTTIDYGTKTFSLTRKGAAAQEFQATADELSLPLRITSSGFLSGEVQLQGYDSPLNFIVDTGASVSVISDEVAKAEGISAHLNSEKLRVFGSAGVTDNVPTYKLPAVTFGKHTRNDVTAIALDLGVINETTGFEQAGILGGNFLSNYKLTFDFRNSKVVFTPISPQHNE